MKRHDNYCTKTIRKLIAQKLTTKRIQHGLNKSQVDKALKFRTRKTYDIETSRLNLDLYTANLFAKLYKCKMEDFLIK